MTSKDGVSLKKEGESMIKEKKLHDSRRKS